MGGTRPEQIDLHTLATAVSTDSVYLCASFTAEALEAPLLVALLDQIRTGVYKAHARPRVLLAELAPDSATARPRLGGSARWPGARSDRLSPRPVPGPGPLAELAQK
jgi:hypothetical protein